MSTITFTVLCRAQPQGSAKYVGHRGGHAIITSDNPKMKPYRESVGWTALEARQREGFEMAAHHVPVAVHLKFYLARPKSAPKARTRPVTKPDGDKLVRATWDALTGILYADDGQVVELSAAKFYGLPERVEITVTILKGE